MSADCLAQAANGTCSTVRGLPQSHAIEIGHSVGAGAFNSAVDTRTIQTALNQVPLQAGGPTPSLTVDGLVGPLTIAAIRRFQQVQVDIVDGRIDPGGPTLAALRLDAQGIPIAAAPPATAGAAPKAPQKPEFLPPDPAIMTLVQEQLQQVRALIRAATFRCDSAEPFITTSKLSSPADLFQATARESIRLLDGVFSLGAFRNPRPSFDNIKRVYRNMDVALNRTFENAPLIARQLFVPNTHLSMESKAAAYTFSGGAFVKDSKVLFAVINEPVDRIYVCRNMLTASKEFQSNVLVHELAHYVSGQPILINDVVKIGHMINAAARPSFDKIKPEDKVRSAEHYAFFALVAKNPSRL